MKRFFDIFLSLTSVIILLPVFLIIAVYIKVDSKGPVFFKHKRIGKDNKYIYVYKFRSMVVNAKEIFDSFTEEQKREYEENFKLENDPRITRAGKFLRETSLDELPQLINILIGNMSIVGPRPIVDKEREKYSDLFQKLVSVKPGLTGLWQANGRSTTTYEERVKMDMDYVDKRSLWLDFKIILKTFVSVLRKEGAI